MRGFATAMLRDQSRAGALLAIVPAARITTSGNATPTSPFIVVRNRITTAPFERATRRGGFTIHIHDDPRSYVQIDNIADLVDAILFSSVPQHWNSHWVSQIENLGWSEDLFDDHYGTGTRFATYGLNYSA